MFFKKISSAITTELIFCYVLYRVCLKNTKNGKLKELFNNLQPSLWSLDASHLDSGKGFIQLLGDRSHLVHAAWEANLFAVVHDLSNRRDNSSSTAKTALCEILHFVEVYFSFLSLKSKVLFRNVDQRTTCDGWKDTVRPVSYTHLTLPTTPYV